MICVYPLAYPTRRAKRIPGGVVYWMHILRCCFKESVVTVLLRIDFFSHRRQWRRDLFQQCSFHPSRIFEVDIVTHIFFFTAIHTLTSITCFLKLYGYLGRAALGYIF